jgi:hypothetical protein
MKWVLIYSVNRNLKSFRKRKIKSPDISKRWSKYVVKKKETEKEKEKFN